MYPPFEMCAVASLLGGALGRMFGGSSNFLVTFERTSIYLTGPWGWCREPLCPARMCPAQLSDAVVRRSCPTRMSVTDVRHGLMLMY